MAQPTSNLHICYAIIQGWQRALAEIVVAARDHTTIAS
jgi:hypothetical protein